MSSIYKFEQASGDFVAGSSMTGRTSRILSTDVERSVQAWKDPQTAANEILAHANRISYDTEEGKAFDARNWRVLIGPHFVFSGPFDASAIKQKR